MEELTARLQTIVSGPVNGHDDDSISYFGPNGKYGSYFKPLIEEYYHTSLQQIIRRIQNEEPKKSAETADEFIKTYLPSLVIPEPLEAPVIDPMEAPNALSVGKIVATPVDAMQMPLMYELLLETGADVNFSCFGGDRTESALAYAIKYHFGSSHHIHIIQSLLDHEARLFYAEIKLLPQLFIHAASHERDTYFKLLENAAENSHILLQNIIDSEGNTPIHTAIILHNLSKQQRHKNKKQKTVRNLFDDGKENAQKANEKNDGISVLDEDKVNEAHVNVLSRLCERYPFWVNRRNYANDYPLYLSAKYRDNESSLCLLRCISLNQAVSCNTMSDLKGNNPLHMALQSSYHKNKRNEDIHSHLKQQQKVTILSQLCKRYPHWAKSTNADNEYPLYVSVKRKDIATTFCLLSFLSGNDTASLYQMMKQKVFVQNMISWIIDPLLISSDSKSNHTVLIRLFLELFKHENIFRWPQSSNLNEPSSPITLISYVNDKDEKVRNHIMNILIKQCNIEQYVNSEALTEPPKRTEYQRKVHTKFIIRLDEDYEAEQKQDRAEETDDEGSEPEDGGESEEEKQDKDAVMDQNTYHMSDEELALYVANESEA
eukprot:717376_1